MTLSGARIAPYNSIGQLLLPTHRMTHPILPLVLCCGCAVPVFVSHFKLRDAHISSNAQTAHDATPASKAARRASSGDSPSPDGCRGPTDRDTATRLRDSDVSSWGGGRRRLPHTISTGFATVTTQPTTRTATANLGVPSTCTGFAPT